MKLARCPSCHAHINLDTLIQDSGAKLLMSSITKLNFRMTSSVISYIALWRPAKSDLNNERAARLIEEVLALHSNQDVLIAALEQTTTSIRNNREYGTAKPLKNHNYLKQVLATISSKESTAVVNSGKPSHAVIVNQGRIETPEENQAKFEEQLNRFKNS